MSTLKELRERLKKTLDYGRFDGIDPGRKGVAARVSWSVPGIDWQVRFPVLR